MRREFSKELEEDRQFEIGKEIFTFRYPHWEETASLYDQDLEEIKDSNGAFSFKEDTETAIERVKIFLEDVNEKKRWDALVKRKTDPVPRHQIVQCYRWLVEVTSGRPTTAPSDSEQSDGGSEPSSPADGS